MSEWTDDPASIRPMLATTGDARLDAPTLAYEPKYDGIRALALCSPTCEVPSTASTSVGSHHDPASQRWPAGPPRRRIDPAVKKPDTTYTVRLWSRLGNDKTLQFPEIAKALRAAFGPDLSAAARGANAEARAAAVGRVVLLDGELVALDERGEPVGFQNLQGRIHSKKPVERTRPGSPRIAFIVFDLLRDGDEDVRPLPLRERRGRLERLFATIDDPHLRISEHEVGDGQALQERAQRRGWEGLVAKRLDAPYKSGRRSPDWRTLKLARRQTCVVGGWTEPRGSRPFFGALLLGLHDEQGRLQCVGHTGAGFSDAELGRVWKRLQSLKTKTCPFATTPKTNERPHWAKPVLAAEVKFTEWTSDRKLRHPTYLGLRDDVTPAKLPARIRRGQGEARTTEPREGGQVRPLAADRTPKSPITKGDVKKLLTQLDDIQHRGGDGVLELPGGDRLEMSNLGKIYWPTLKLTKGDLFRHYVRVAPWLLPVLADRPLVMKRYPNGVSAKPFYQHRAPERPPRGVRVEVVASDNERRAHLIGGDVKTLLYTVQLASISQDPWFSRVGALHVIDHVAIDLDPPEGLPFARVLDVARWVRDELDAMRAPGFPKTSGSGGLHIYVPMPPGTAYGAGLLFCQIAATVVAMKHPKQATVERSITARGQRIYVDYLQNVLGKTLASAYSARANDFAGVSTPLTWKELDEGVSPKDFTIQTFAARMATVGDLWAALRRSKGADLSAVARYTKKDAV